MTDYLKQDELEDATVGELLYFLNKYKEEGSITDESPLRLCPFFEERESHYELKSGAIGCNPKNGHFHIFVNISPIAIDKEWEIE